MRCGGNEGRGGSGSDVCPFVGVERHLLIVKEQEDHTITQIRSTIGINKDLRVRLGMGRWWRLCLFLSLRLFSQHRTILPHNRTFETMQLTGSYFIQTVFEVALDNPENWGPWVDLASELVRATFCCASWTIWDHMGCGTRQNKVWLQCSLKGKKRFGILKSWVMAKVSRAFQKINDVVWVELFFFFFSPDPF